MSKTFTVMNFNTAIRKIEKQYNMNQQERKTFRTANLYRALRRELYLKKGI